MKNIKKYIRLSIKVAVAGLLLLTFSCEEYLKDELLSETSVDFIYNTQEGLELATVGLYDLNRRLIQNGGLKNSGIPLVPQAKTDLVLPRAGEIAFMARQVTWGIDQTRHGTKALKHFWQHYYRLIDRCNALITYAENVSFDDEARKKQLLAEAKCFRANSYFTLYRQFNNIFLTTEPTTPENGFDRPEDKSSVEDIFNLLNSDLDDAITSLNWTSDETGRWTQAAARHLKAKVAMWEGDWAEAALQADSVINNGNYTLVSKTRNVFYNDMNHAENLFSIQYKENAIGGSRTNQMNFQLIAAYDLAPGAKFSIENGANGLGGILMNDYIVRLLAEDPNDDRDEGTYYITVYKYNDAENLPEGKQIGDSITIYDRNSPDKAERLNFYRILNPGCLKFLQESADPAEVNHISTIMVYRLAETYLIGAEAHMKLNNISKALEYINIVRDRANAADLASIDMKAISDERARELGFEGQRFYFLKRTGTFLSQIQQYAGDDAGDFADARTAVQDYYVNWPIPIAELNLLGPNYPQNEGYPE